MTATQRRLPVAYFVLVFVLAVPFWIFGGRGRLPLPMYLPVGALVTFVPALAASIVRFREDGLAGLKELFKRALDYGRIRDKRWYVPALLLPPAIYAGSFLIQRQAGLPLPEPISVPLILAPVFFVLFFIGDTGEELGWSGHAIDPMQDRWGALRGGLILGIVWAVWHTVPFLQTNNPATWVLWQGVQTVGARVLIVWIYNNTGKSVFGALLYHVMNNVSWSLYPNFASHYNPFITSVVTWLVVIVIAAIWEPGTLARPRTASLPVGSK